MRSPSPCKIPQQPGRSCSIPPEGSRMSDKHPGFVAAVHARTNSLHESVIDPLRVNGLAGFAPTGDTWLSDRMVSTQAPLHAAN